MPGACARRTGKQIVYVSGYADYILEGSEVEALCHLLKPVTEEKPIQVLDRAAQKITRNERAIYVNRGAETARVPLNEIRYIVVMRNLVTLHAREN